MANLQMDTEGGSNAKNKKSHSDGGRNIAVSAAEKQAALKKAQAEKEYNAQKKAEAAEKAKVEAAEKAEKEQQRKAKAEAAKKNDNKDKPKAKSTPTSNSNKQKSNNNKDNKQKSNGGDAKKPTGSNGGGKQGAATDGTDTGNLQIDQLMDLIPDIANSYTQPAYTDVTDPALKTASELADLFGLTYDKDAINKIFNDAVAQQFATRYLQQGVTENNYYDQMAALQNTSLDTLRQQQSQAIMNGASKGMQAANQLSAVLGTSQTAAQTASALAQTRGQLATEQGAAQAKAIQDAMSYYDQMGMGLGELSKQLYSYDVQQQAAQLGYNQGINTDAAGVAAQNTAAQATLDSALAQSIANIYGGQNSAAASNYSADQNYKSNVYTANSNAGASKYAADSNAAASNYAANTSANASRYAADKNATTYAATTGGSNKTMDPDLYNKIVNSTKLPDYVKNQMISYFTPKY